MISHEIAKVFQSFDSSIEIESANTIDFSDMIPKFVALKARKEKL